MLVTRCVDCGHEELTFNSDCRCGCHSLFAVPASLQVKDGTTSSLLDRIAALEAQLAEAQRLLSCLLDKPEDRMYHSEDRTWWRRDGDRLLSADPPPEIAEAQARLAMAGEKEKEKENDCG